MNRFILSAIAIFSLSLLCVLAVRFFVTGNSEPTIRPSIVSPNQLNLGETPVGQCSAFITLNNTGSEIVEIVGINAMCTTNYCFESGSILPFSIPPNSTSQFHIEFTIKKPGPIDAIVNIYISDFALRTIAVRVTGNAVEAPLAPK